MRKQCLKVHQGRFRLGVREISSWEGWLDIGMGALGSGGVNFPAVFKRSVDVVLRNVVR